MSKELYLYTGIYDFSAQELIAQIEENMGEEVVLREMCPGGSVFATHGICAKLVEHGNITIKVDGCAMSSGANLLPYAKRVICLDVSKFLLHRADMDIESTEDQIFLDSINKDLKAKLLLKVDASKFKEVTGYTINDMFNPSQRINITLNAKEAKDIGLVDEIVKLSPKEITALNERLCGISASSEITKKEILTPKNKNKMD
jgi:ATP-dependent protease ClpP protease subunit